MALFVDIVLRVIVPIFVVIAVGALLQRRFHLDMGTLSKLTTYFVMPAIAFVNMYDSEMTVELLGQIAVFLALQNGALMIMTSLLVRMKGYPGDLSSVLKNSIVLNNSGNFGLSVSQLVFHGSVLGSSIQVIVLILQNLLTYTYGLFNSVSAKQKGSAAVIEFLKIPILYAVIAGLALNYYDLTLPSFLWTPIENISDAFLAVALFALGAQVAYLKLYQLSAPLLLGMLGRLVLSPALGFAFVMVLGLEGVVAQALFIASSFPSSRSSAQFALEYNNQPELAAQIVLWTTLLSSVTVSLAIWFALWYWV